MPARPPPAVRMPCMQQRLVVLCSRHRPSASQHGTRCSSSLAAGRSRSESRAVGLPPACSRSRNAPGEIFAAPVTAKPGRRATCAAAGSSSSRGFSDVKPRQGRAGGGEVRIRVYRARCWRWLSLPQCDAVGANYGHARIMTLFDPCTSACGDRSSISPLSCVKSRSQLCIIKTSRPSRSGSHRRCYCRHPFPVRS